MVVHYGADVKNENIPEIEKQYPDEWLLFEVYETDNSNRPTRGKLLAHSPSRTALDEYWDKIEVKFPYVVWTGPKPKKGFVSVL